MRMASNFRSCVQEHLYNIEIARLYRLNQSWLILSFQSEFRSRRKQEPDKFNTTEYSRFGERRSANFTDGVHLGPTLNQRLNSFKLILDSKVV